MSDPKIRLWGSDEGSCTMVLLRGDDVLMHTNLGWVGPLSKDEDDTRTPEQIAVDLAAGYELVERSQEYINDILGIPDPSRCASDCGAPPTHAHDGYPCCGGYMCCPEAEE